MQSSKRPISKAKSGKNPSLRRFPFSNTKAHSDTRLDNPYRAEALASSRLPTASETRQQVVDTVNARSFLYRFVAKMFEFPQPKAWHWLSNPAIQTSFCSAVRKLDLAEAPLRRSAQDLVLQLHPGQFEPFREDYLSLFSHSARNPCPIREMDYPVLPSLFQPAQPDLLANLISLFRKFGLEMAGAATERQDHICTELEFMSVLAAKEAYALERSWREQQAHCFKAQKKFVREHLGRWVPAFCQRVQRSVGPGVLSSLARFTHAFVETECQKFAVKLASQDLIPQPPGASLEKFYRGGDSLSP